MDLSATAPGRAGHRSPGTTRSIVGLLSMLLASAGATVLLALRILRVAPAGPDAARALRVETWVETVVLLAGLGAAAWTLLGTVAALAGVVAVRRGRPGRTSETVVGRWAPSVVRRLARGAVGAGVGAGLALTPAAALADEQPGPGTAPAAVLQLGWESTAPETAPGAGPAADDELPDPPAPADEAEEPEAPEKEPEGPAHQQVDAPPDEVDPVLSGARQASNPVDEPREVVVVRGDTLWDIAARDLPEGASDADVLRSVTTWHDLNRDVIGDDPDTILPGQVLRAP